MKLKRQQQGMAMVEFAIVGTLLLTILFGICDMAILLCDQALITNASREAARSVIVLRIPPTLTLTNAQLQAMASTAASYYNSFLINSVKVSPTVTATNLAADANGTPVQVNVQYNYSYFVLNKLLDLMHPLTPGPKTKLLSATTTMYYE